MDSVSWEKFRRVFQSKFYPSSFYDAKRNEIMSLVQGDITILKYEKKFTKLTKYTLAYVLDDADKCKHFGDGPRKKFEPQ